MRRPLTFLFLGLVGLFALACSLPGLGGLLGSQATATPTPARGFCGDGICNGPENHRTCPRDCAEGEHGHAGRRGTATLQVTAQPTTAAVSSDEITLAAINAFITLDRDPGPGTCGQKPWLSSTCTNGVEWWGVHLKAASINTLLVIPDGENRWVLTNNPDVLTTYGYDPADLAPNGYYQEAEYTDYAGHNECHGEIRGNHFKAFPLATYENGQFVITFSFDPLPEEHAYGACATAGFDWHLHNLLYGWGAAMSGDPLDMTAVLTEADHQGTGKYEHIFQADTNPSPENRDHVTAKVMVMCLTPASEGSLETLYKAPCPWEK